MREISCLFLISRPIVTCFPWSCVFSVFSEFMIMMSLKVITQISYLITSACWRHHRDGFWDLVFRGPSLYPCCPVRELQLPECSARRNVTHACWQSMAPFCGWQQLRLHLRPPRLRWALLPRASHGLPHQVRAPGPCSPLLLGNSSPGRRLVAAQPSDYCVNIIRLLC